MGLRITNACKCSAGYAAAEARIPCPIHHRSCVLLKTRPLSRAPDIARRQRGQTDRVSSRRTGRPRESVPRAVNAHFSADDRWQKWHVSGLGSVAINPPSGQRRHPYYGPESGWSLCIRITSRVPLLRVALIWPLRCPVFGCLKSLQARWLCTGLGKHYGFSATPGQRRHCKF